MKNNREISLAAKSTLTAVSQINYILLFYHFCVKRINLSFDVWNGRGKIQASRRIYQAHYPQQMFEHVYTFVNGHTRLH